MSPLDAAKVAAQAAAEKKAVRIVLQDLNGLSDVCQYQLICSGTNERQTQAICQGIEDTLRENYGIKPAAIEGKQSGHWILLDYGATIIHVFLDSIRDYYAIEGLWGRAKMINPADPS